MGRDRFRLTYVCLVFLLPACTGNSMADEIWPQWRGPNRDSRIRDAGWPLSLAEDRLQAKWRVELGPSYSGPIVSSDRVFVTETLDEKFEVVRALDRNTGKELWSQRWEGSLSVAFFAKANGDWIRSTPAFDGERLYVAGMRDVLVCLDAASGAVRWRIDFPRQFDTPLPGFGFVCSPLLHGDFVFVQAGAALTKIDKRTGKVLWRSLQEGTTTYDSAFSSPYPTRIDGVEQLLVQTRTRLAGVDLDSGEVLWQQEIPAFRGMNILTPTVVGDSIFTASYGGSAVLLSPRRSGDKWTVTETWRNKVQGYMSSPVVYDGHIYLHLRNQRFVCIDAQTGKTSWTTTPFGQYWSMVASGDKMLALDERGELLLIRAEPDKYEQLDQRHVSDNPTWAHLAVCGDEVFVRDLEGLTVYRWK